MWVEISKPNGKRLLLNLDLTFAFDEQDDGSAQAISINGIGAPTGATFAEISQQIEEQYK